jgi:hypothetical protein
MWYALAVLLVGYLPGALIVRLPVADRSRRASLPAEERVFWGVALSVGWSSLVALGLGAAGWYAFDSLLWLNGIFVLAVLASVRGRLRLGAAAPRPTWHSALPAALVLVGALMFFAVPPAEYIMGGKDPGVYMNEGIQIAQRGNLVTYDRVVASVPPNFRTLFFPTRGDPTYYSNRFMGFFLLDPDEGTVVSQFPHLYPVWIAIGYGVHGLSGARWILGLWGLFGLAAVYFLGTRIAGRPAAAAGAGLLAVHVAQVWYARYPNAELVMQPIVFAGLLAFVRAHTDDDRFFAPVAGLALGLAIFAHITGALAAAAFAMAAVVARIGGQRLRLSFVLPLIAGTAVAVAYLMSFLPPYFAIPVRYLANLSAWQTIALALLPVSGIVLWRWASHPVRGHRVRRWLPGVLVTAVWAGAAYAFFFREPRGALALHDAYALRTFVEFYLSPYGLAAALAGFWMLSRGASFWTSVPFLVVMSVFSFLFFYKIRIVPEHFWAARRFLAVILPGTLLLIGTAAFSELRVTESGRFRWFNRRPVQALRYLLGCVLVALLGWRLLDSTQAIRRYVEYAGLIPHLETLAASAGDDDLVLVESRGASDVHVLALPLAYVYARNVLVLATPTPDKAEFREFLAWARDRYARILFVGGSGTEVAWRTMAVRTVGEDRFQVPEYELAMNAYPRGARLKPFDFGIYEFLSGSVEPQGFELDVGTADDLYISRFHARERRPTGATFRWTRDESYVSVVGARPGCLQLTLWIGSGGRPAAAEPARVELFLDEHALGAVTVGDAFEPHSFAIPPDLADEIADSDAGARLRIRSSTWNPAALLGGIDNRSLGVMVDRIAVACPADPNAPAVQMR